MDSNGGEAGGNSNGGEAGGNETRKRFFKDEPYLTLDLTLDTYRHLFAAPVQEPPPSTNPDPPYVPPSEEEDSYTFRFRRAKVSPSTPPPPEKSETVPAVYPWSTEFRATVRSLTYLLANQIFTVSGDVQCKKCEHRFTMEYDVEEKFRELSTFIVERKGRMFQRAPALWMSPVLPNCPKCNQEKCVKPVMAEKKRAVNWLFLLLGQLLGCCTLDQLKYFCKHTKTHRTGAKDRVLYLTYMGLCKQLDPDGPYDI